MDNAVNKGVCNDFSNLLGTYEEHKLYTYKVIDLLKNDYTFRDFGSSDRRYFDMLNCGTSLHFKNSDCVWHLVGANFCRQRICPMCQYRKSIKTFVQMSKVVDYLKDDCEMSLIKVVKACHLAFTKRDLAFIMLAHFALMPWW